MAPVAACLCAGGCVAEAHVAACLWGGNAWRGAAVCSSGLAFAGACVPLCPCAPYVPQAGGSVLPILLQKRHMPEGAPQPHPRRTRQRTPTRSPDLSGF